MESRAEHLEWCKRRALEYLPDDPKNAMASMLSDLGKHPGTAGSAQIGMEIAPFRYGQGNNPEELRKWIEGFN